MEGRVTRLKAKAGTSIIPNNPVTTSKRRRRVEARKLNEKQRTKEQNVNELNLQEQNVEEENMEQNGEDNVEEQHIAQISFYTSKKPRNLVTTSERSRRVKARKLNKNQRTVNEINVKEQNGEQNIEKHNVEEHNVEEEQNGEQNIEKHNVEEHNVEEEQNGEQNIEKHNVEEQHTAHTSFDNSKRPCHPVTTSERNISVKAGILDKKQKTEEQKGNELYVDKQNVEQNIEEQWVEEHIVEEQHTAHISLAPLPLSTEDTSIQHEQESEETISASIQQEQESEETISASIQQEQETISTSVRLERKTNSVEINQQMRAKKSIEFNRHGEAVGPNAIHFKTQVGRFVRKLVPISYATWKKVPENYKDAVWNEIVKIFEVPSYMKKNVEYSMPSAFRSFKHSLRKYYLDKHPNLEARKLDIPTGMKKEDWEKFCIHESNEEQIKRRAQAVQSQMKSPFGHTGGRRSASMIEYEMMAKGNHSVTRTDVWLAAHIRKDGTVLRSAEPFVEKVKAKVDEFKRSGGSGSGHILSIEDDPLAQVLGKKHRTLPGVGSNVSRSRYEAALHPHVMYSAERTQKELLEKRIDKMEAQLDFIVNRCTPQVARESSTPTATLVVDDDGSSASTAMKNHFVEGENYVQSKSAESMPNARMCELLDWNRKCVAIAKEVTDPTHKAICHGYHLKTEYEMKVSMCDRKILNAKLYKETSDAKRIKDIGVGDFLVWPVSHISFLGSDK